MSLGWVLDRTDNPIFMKYVRSRLRRQPLISSITILFALCMCVVWGGYQLDGFRTGGVFGALLAIQCVVLGILGANQVGTAIGNARGLGIMDFHRVSPLTPTELVLGFFFGAPVREYVLFAVTLPFSILCVAFGTPDFRGFVQIMILLIAVCWVMHGLALLNALVMKKQTGSRGVVGLVVVIAMVGGNLFTTFGNIAVHLDEDPRLEFFGISLPWLPVILLNLMPLLFFTFLASRRKIDSERIHPLSKPQAIAAMVTLGVLILGGVWTRKHFEPIPIIVLYVLTLVGIVLTAMVTPNQSEYSKGLWRANKLGLARLPYLHDFALNRVFLAVISMLVLITATLVWSRMEPPDTLLLVFSPNHISLAIAVGVLVVAYHGLALQYFLLRFGRKAPALIVLFVFFLWFLPLIAGTIQSIAWMQDNNFNAAIFALSPIAGIGLTAADLPFSNDTVYMWVANAALTPSLLFTFVFNALVTSAKRRVRVAVLLAMEKTKKILPAVE